jgi:DNA-binding NarL/FixJ family response regulator
MSIKVFIADDHAVFRDGLRSLLEAQEDIAVIGEAGNGRDAVREVKRLNPDVVVMDIAMAELNGIEATAQIRSTHPSSRVVILSMYKSDEHISRSLKAGAWGYLLKESAGAEVIDAIRNVHAGQRYMSRKVLDHIWSDYLSSGTGTEVKDPLAVLSPREREVLQLVVEGKTSSEIADILFLSPNTVDTYRGRIMQKLNVNNLPGLVKFAIQHGLTTLER